MVNTKLLLTCLLVFCLSLVSVSAETYTLDLVDQQNNPVDAKAYIYLCTTDACTQAEPNFTPIIIDSTNQQIVFDTPQTQQKETYAIFYYSNGFLGEKGRFYQTGTVDADVTGTVAFSQKDICYAPIISHYVVNDVIEYQPIQINVSAEIGAEVASAFRLSGGSPSFIPPEATGAESSFWTANTLITIKITDGNGVVHTISESANIFADESKDFTFTWIPEVEGQTDVEIVATIDDNQCVQSESVTRTDSFTVLKDLSESFYHAFIFDAKAPAYPVANEDFDVTFDTLSYFYDNNMSTATPTEIDYVVYAENGNIVAANTYVVPAIGAQTFQETAFTLNLPAGEYDVRIIATADDYTYNAQRNDAYVNLDVIVEDARYDLTVTAIDELTNEAISNARIDINGLVGYAGTNGIYVFQNIFAGQKDIEVSSDGFITEMDSISLTSDLSVEYVLERTTCNDEIDNDGDELIDYPNDPDCLSINDQENRFDQPEDDTFTLTVNLQDGLDNSPLADVDITFEGQSFVTSSSGTISFNNLDADNYTFSASKFGWVPYTGMIFEITENTTYTITLTRTTCNDLIDNENDGFTDLADPECSTIDETEGLIDNSNESDLYDFTLTILDASTTNPIGGVYVEFGGVNFITNNNGVISIEDLVVGNYSYEASLLGYNTATGVYEITEDTNEILYLVSENNQVQFDLFATPLVGSYNDSSDVIICQDNFAFGYNNTVEVPVTVLLNGVQQTGIQSLTFGNPVRECLNFGILPNGTYTIIQTIDPFNQFADDDRSNNLFSYTFIVGTSNNGGGNNGGGSDEDVSEIPHIGITAFDFFVIDYSKASELDQIQIGLTNDGDFRMKDVVITLSIPELAVWDRVRIDELYVGETEYDYLHLGVYEEYEPGYYDLRVSVMTSSGYSRARWYEVYLE